MIGTISENSVNAMSWARFNYSVYPNLDETYKKISELLKKAHVSDATLRAFDDWCAVLKSLPWDKTGLFNLDQKGAGCLAFSSLQSLFRERCNRC